MIFMIFDKFINFINSMTLVNWIITAVLAFVIIAGIVLFCLFRRKFVKMDGFEGIITEQGSKRPRREDFGWCRAEIERLKKEHK